MPKISVLIPVFNSEKFLEKCLESVIFQDFSDFEIVICDDGSDDKSKKIIKNFQKKFPEKIIFLQNEKNLWIAKTRNILAKNARGKYLAWMDSDDIMLKNRLRMQYDFLEKNPEIGILGTNFWILMKNGEKIARNPPEIHDEIVKNLFLRNPFGQFTIMIRKKIFQKIGWYDESFSVSEDLEFYIRAQKITKMANLRERLVIYRIHENNSIICEYKKILKNTYKIQKNMIKNGYKMNFREKFFHFLFFLGNLFPFVWKYLIYMPERLRKFLKKFKFF